MLRSSLDDAPGNPKAGGWGATRRMQGSVRSVQDCAHDGLPVHEITTAAICLPAEMALPGLQVEEPTVLCGCSVVCKVLTTNLPALAWAGQLLLSPPLRDEELRLEARGGGRILPTVRGWVSSSALAAGAWQ